MKKAFLPNIFIIILFSCQTTQYSSPESFQGKQIIISENGGFSGQTTQHIILENGQVFARTIFPASLKEMDKLKKKTVQEIFKKVDLLNISGINFQHPGNMTHSLAFSNGQELYEVKWGDPGFQVPDSIQECYQFIRNQLTTK